MSVAILIPVKVKEERESGRIESTEIIERVCVKENNSFTNDSLRVSIFVYDVCVERKRRETRYSFVAFVAFWYEFFSSSHITTTTTTKKALAIFETRLLLLHSRFLSL